MFKTLMDSVFTNISFRINGIVKDELQILRQVCSSAKTIYPSNRRRSYQWTPMSPVSKKLSTNISRRPFIWKIKVNGLVKNPNEMWEDTEGKIKNVLAEKLDLDPAPEIDQAHRTGRHTRQDGTSTLRTVVRKFTSYKAKESILRKARRIELEGSSIFKDLAEETMAKRRSQLPQLKQAKQQEKTAYFSLHKSIIRDRPSDSGSTTSPLSNE